jgi:ribonuclease HI
VSEVVSGQVKVHNPGPLVFATDGSVARKMRDREYLTGFGYLSTDGHWAAACCPQPATLSGRDRAVVAELRAVWHAVGPMLPTTPVTVLTDSQSACRFVEEWKTGSERMPAGYLGSARHTPRLLVLARAVALHPDNLTVRWVRGHAGHLLNEGADCLARLGCRWSVQRLTRAAVADRARFVAEGFLADPGVWAAAA